MNIPKLYSISTVCLLKHYNQDYLLHSLRTDFTGANGVGKSIISDLFQIVFVADTKYIKFATEGINNKKRTIETLPYESGIGYAFYNVEVSPGQFIIVGAAIFSQGNTVVKPFIITSNININTSIAQNTFTSDKLLYSKSFLKTNGEAYTLDDLSRIAPDKYKLYVHHFTTKEERLNYYDWLYKNSILSINLAKESNLKAFAKVIQSFSKSKSLDINSSPSLIEYLFEENETEIEQEYKQQEEAVRRLLHEFKITKTNIEDIRSKQKSLQGLKELEKLKEEAEYKLLFFDYIATFKRKREKQNILNNTEKQIEDKNKKRTNLLERSTQFHELVTNSSLIGIKEDTAYNELVKSRVIFEKLEKTIAEREIIKSIDTKNLLKIDATPEENLANKDAQFYMDSIDKSIDVLKRYSNIKTLEDKKKEQVEWLKKVIRDIDEKETELLEFSKILSNLNDNSFFIKALSTTSKLSDAQKSILLHLRNVSYNKPEHVQEGARYTDTTSLINEENIIKDSQNKGWWLKTGGLNEFISEKSVLIPDLAKLDISTLSQLKIQLDKEIAILREKRLTYQELSNGNKPIDFNEYNFDIDLSDNTKISQHKLAAKLCGVINHKLNILKTQYNKEYEELSTIKKKFDISIDDIHYDSLIEKMRVRKTIFLKRANHLKSEYEKEQNEINSIKDTLPLLEAQLNKATQELKEEEDNLSKTEASFTTKYPNNSLPNADEISETPNITTLQNTFAKVSGNYINEYNQIIGRYEETKEHRNGIINEQVTTQNFSFDLLEAALLGSKIRALDEITEHLETLNTELLAIADELLKSLVKVFGRTEEYYEVYKNTIQSLNDFFKGKLISNRFYFKIDFNSSSKMDIKWIEQLRRSAGDITTSTNTDLDLSPERFIEDFYLRYSGNKSRVLIEELLNPKRYFVLKVKLTDEHGKEPPGSTGESYTAIALLGIARLSIVQDGDRTGLRFIILEESATLDNVNFSMFPIIAEDYGYQIITMTPKPYAVGGEEGWYIHHLIPGKGNKDINYPEVMSYFRTIKDKIQLETYLKTANL